MNRPKKEYGTFLLFIIFEAIVVLFFYNEYRNEIIRHSALHENNLKSLYDSAFLGYDYATKMIFNNIVNRPEVLQKIAIAWIQKDLRNQYRKDLYNKLKKDYEAQKEISLRQFHFHFKDGTSFLRMHAPEKYGDFLFDKRYSLRQANQEQRPVKGFEEGHFADGFRYVYPLFYSGEHIGSVEIDITADGIMEHLAKIDQTLYHFIIRKDKVMSITYTDWREAHYKPSDFSNDFVVDKSFKEFSNITRINKLLKSSIGKKLPGFIPFVERARLMGQEYVITFLPIKNVKGENIAYLIQYNPDDFFRRNILNFIRNLIIVSLFILMVFYSYRKVKSQHREVEILNQSLEARVQERTAELETAIKELEDFNYSVSHDLRTPLRAINGFSQILLDDYEKHLDDEGKRLLKVVSKNAIRMGKLIDDILYFSRLGRITMDLKKIDMAQLAKNAWEKLKSSLEQRDVHVDIKPLPPAFGDFDLLHQVIFNLLANALKFTLKKKSAYIEIGSKVELEENIYFVKDNGCGFDMMYLDKLFGVFNRLHGVDEYEGTGIGLAVVKRIILKHGGRVWAEGKPDEGATFYFSLPKR